jgi:hypothetical protein
MARHEDMCWRCGARWAPEEVPRTTLRAIAGGQLAPPLGDAVPLAAVAAGS